MSYIGANGIGKIFLGNTQIAKAYLGGTLVYQYGSGPTPPPVVGKAYIRGGGDGSYIDTGITADSTTRIIVWARNVNPSSVGWSHIFGSRLDSSTNCFLLAIPYTANIGRLYIGYGSNNAYSGDSFRYMSGYHKYELFNGVLSVDDVSIATATTSQFSNSNNIYLFGVNSGNTLASCRLPLDICACKIYKNNVLVRDFAAVNTPSVGLYDSVSNTMFTNAGSGAFTYGTFNENAYTPLEYISCSGEQYFNSGVYGTYGLAFICKFMPTNTTAVWNTLLGQRISSPANSCDLAFGTATSGQDNMYLYWRFGANTTSGQAFSGNSSNKLTNKEIVVTKTNMTAAVYYNKTSIGSNSKTGVSSSFTTTYPLTIGNVRTGESSYAKGFQGRLYYVGLGEEKNLVPSKVDNVAGMYDTYNDVFYPSTSGTAFTAGPEL